MRLQDARRRKERSCLRTRGEGGGEFRWVRYLAGWMRFRIRASARHSTLRTSSHDDELCDTSVEGLCRFIGSVRMRITA